MNVHYNRSYPLHSYTESFELEEVDPRPIDSDLERIWVSMDPRSVYFLWRETETTFQIEHSSLYATVFQYLLQARIFNGDIENKIASWADAISALEAEESQWLSGFEKEGVYTKLAGYTNPDTPEGLSKAPMPAIGFWLVPVGALDELPEGKSEDQRWQVTRMVDLRNYRPQLGVFHLLVTRQSRHANNA